MSVSSLDRAIVVARSARSEERFSDEVCKEGRTYVRRTAKLVTQR